MRSPLLLALAVLVAGCVGGGSEPASSPSPTTGSDLEAAVIPDLAAVAPAGDVAPVWNVGDAWSMVQINGDEETRGFAVVTRADSSAYFMETTIESIAAWDAMMDVSWVGRIRASDLAGEQQGQTVQYFSFPLEDGKTWSTSWDGGTVELTAKKSGTGFDIVGTRDGQPYVSYDYAPELRWWSKLDFLQDNFGMRFERVQTGWTGEVTTAVSKLVYESGAQAPVLSPGSGAFTIDEGQSYGFIVYAGGGAAYLRAFQLFDPAGQPHLTENIGNAEWSVEGRRNFITEQIPPTPGEWHVVAPALHDPEGGFYLAIHQIAIETRMVG